MISGDIFAWGAVIVGALIVLTRMFKWPQWLHYLWGIIVLVWGAMALL